MIFKYSIIFYLNLNLICIIVFNFSETMQVIFISAVFLSLIAIPSDGFFWPECFCPGPPPCPPSPECPKCEIGQFRCPVIPSCPKLECQNLQCAGFNCPDIPPCPKYDCPKFTCPKIPGCECESEVWIKS